MAIRVNGTLKSTFPGQFDKQLHSVEWFYNGEWRRIWDTVYPLNDAEILDDTLDCGGFMFINELEPYPDEDIKNLIQLTPIRILWDSEDDNFDVTKPVEHPIWRYRVVDSVNVKQNGRTFTFTVKTLEPTKLLEFVQCDTLTFTRKLGHAIALGSIEAHFDRKEGEYRDLLSEGVLGEFGSGVSPYLYAKIRLTTLSSIFNPIIKGSTITVPLILWGLQLNGPLAGWTYPKKIKVTMTSDADEVEQELFTYECDNGSADLEDLSPFETTVDTAGEYTLRYYPLDGNDKDQKCYAILQFSVVDAIPDQIDLSITSVLERVLSAGKTCREGIDRQMFKLAPTVAEAYSAVQAPEFAITRCTMWEALKTVAGHIHCIPRLMWDDDENSFDLVTLDKLGGMDECVLRAEHNGNSIAFDRDKTLDSYCGSIETYIDNLVNTRDEAAGTIVEPYVTGWLTTRAKGDGSIIIEDNTAVFKLSRPNMRISKLEIRYNGKEADITPYLFEEAEYKTLSQYEGSYPNSANFALKYAINGQEVTELGHVIEGENLTDLGDLFKISAIRNIAQACGIGDIPIGDFKNIQYRVTYSPIISTRIVQKKPYLDKQNAFSRVYNMDGSMLESEYVGEHLKGAIARLGNDVEKRTYYFKRAKDVPVPGQLLDGMYIMQVITEIVARDVIHATLVLSEDYNQKNEYVAIDSNVRFYDVSEKQSVERHINYCESVIIGDRVESSAAAPLLNREGMDIFRKVFTGDGSNEQISWAWFKGASKKYGVYTPNPPNEIILPCMSQAMGNCLLFNFACADNYGAGWRIYFAINRSRSVQTQVPYGNVYGELYKMDLRLGNHTTFGASLKDDLSTDMPLWKSSTPPTGLLGTGDAPLIIDKDSREQLNVTVQLAMVATRHSIIVGSALCENNPLVTENKNRAAACYLMFERINKFDSRIDVRKGVRITDGYMPTEVASHGSCTEFSLPAIENKTQSTAKAIVWVDESEGASNAKLLIGENIQVLPGESSQEIFVQTSANVS